VPATPTSSARATLRAAALALLLLAALAVFSARASADTYTWIGGSGSYTDTAHWSSGTPNSLPLSTDDVVIAGTADFTVTYAGPPGVQRTVHSLVLGGSSGTQTLLIKTVLNSGDGRLQVDGNATINGHGQVILDQDSTGLPSPSNLPQLTVNGAWTNAGTILARSEGTVYDHTESLGTGTLTNTGTLHVQSGRLETRHVVNSGSVVVDAGARLDFTTGSQAIGFTQNAGTVVNNGSITMANSGWAQNGGAVTGNPVRIDTGQLADAGGTGSFVVVGNGNKISGVVPAGQTVRFGDPAAEMSNYMNIQAGGFTVAPGGTLVIVGPPSNGAELLDNPLTVNGTLQVKPTGLAKVSGGLTVGAGGAIDVQGGLLEVRMAPVNHGTIAIAPGGELRLAGDGFTSDGTLSFGIASPSSFGRLTRISAVTAALGGTATGVLAGGYVPAAGTAFKVFDVAFSGAFGAVGAGFSAQYAADKTSVSLVYDGATPTPAPTPTPTPTPTPMPPAGGGGTPKPIPATPAAVLCVVPDLKTLTLTAATKALKKAHCALGTVKRPHGRAARRAATRVVAQSRKAGTRLAKSTRIGVTMGQPAAKHKHKHKSKARKKR
jgi:hypothetical protein